MVARLFVEGKADDKFLRDYILFLLKDGDPNDLDIIRLDGWTNIPKVEPKFKEHSDAGHINLLILDADDNPIQRRRQILGYKNTIGIDFELFLLPNDQDSGNLETILCQIISQNHQPIFDCFDRYQDCLRNNPTYHVPNLKSKIFAYLEALLPPNQSEMCQDHERNYLNADHWDLDNPNLDPLRKFLFSDNYTYFL